MIDDLDRIMAVMQAAFDPQFGEAWTRRQVEDSLLLPNTHYLLIGADGDSPEPDAAAVGFSLSRQGYEEEELLLFAVRPDHRGKGIGRKLLEKFAESARARGAQRLLLEMRRGNTAEYLYRSFGFSDIGMRPDYYRTAQGGRIDALTFAFDFT